MVIRDMKLETYMWIRHPNTGRVIMVEGYPQDGHHAFEDEEGFEGVNTNDLERGLIYRHPNVLRALTYSDEAVDDIKPAPNDVVERYIGLVPEAAQLPWEDVDGFSPLWDVTKPAPKMLGQKEYQYT